MVNKKSHYNLNTVLVVLVVSIIKIYKCQKGYGHIKVTFKCSFCKPFSCRSADKESVVSSVDLLSESEGEIFEQDGSPQWDGDDATLSPPSPHYSAPEVATAPQLHPPEQALEGVDPPTSRRRQKKWLPPVCKQDEDSGDLRRLELNKLTW